MNLFEPMKLTDKNTLKTAVISLIFAIGVSGCITVKEGANTTNPTKAIEAYTSLAAQYVKRNNLDAAKRNAEKALKIDRYNPAALNMMAIILQRDGSEQNFTKAESYYKRAMSNDSSFVQARNNYGVYLTQAKRYKEAIEQFKIAGSTLGYAGRVSALENLGRTRLRLSDDRNAEIAFRQALAINPNSLIARIELVDILINRKNFEKAHPIYQDYLHTIGDNRQGSRTLLQGILIASALNDGVEFRRLYSILKEDYPNSIEMQKFNKMFGVNHSE